MKRAFLTFVIAVMLTASLTACGGTSADNNGGNGTDSDTARNRMGGNAAMDDRGRYYADGNGDVFGGNDGIGGDIGRAAGDVMDGVGNAVQDMTR